MISSKSTCISSEPLFTAESRCVSNQAWHRPSWFPLRLSRYTRLFIMALKSANELRLQVGQLLIMGFEGTEVSSRLRTTLSTLQPGGIILFRRNIEAPVRPTLSIANAIAISAPRHFSPSISRVAPSIASATLSPYALGRRCCCRWTEKASAQTWASARCRVPHPRLQYRLHSLPRSPLAAIAERDDFAHYLSRSQGNRRRCPRNTARSSRLLHPELRKAFSRSRRRPPRQPQGHAGNRQALQASLGRRPLSLSRAQASVAVRNGLPCLLSRSNWRPHTGLHSA